MNESNQPRGSRRWSWKTRKPVGNTCLDCGSQRLAHSSFCHRCGATFKKTNLSLIAGVSVSLLLCLVLPTLLAREKGQKPEHSAKVQAHATTRARVASAGKKEGPAAIMAEIDRLMLETDRQKQGLRQAIELLDDLTERYPKYSYAIRLKGNLLRNISQPEKASEAYVAYLSLNPNDMNVRTSLALELMVLEQYPQAIAELDKVAEAFPNYADVYNNLSRAYRAQGDEAQAQLFSTRAETVRKQYGVSKPPLVLHPKVYE